MRTTIHFTKARFALAIAIAAACSSEADPTTSRELLTACVGGASGSVGASSGATGVAGVAGLAGAGGEAGGAGAADGGQTGEGGASGVSGAGTGGQNGGAAGTSGSSGDAGSGGVSGSDAGTPGTAGSSAGASGVAGTAGAPCSTDVLTFTVLRAGLLDGNSGGNWEQARDVAFGADGSMYVVGGTSSADFPTTAGAYDTTRDGGGSSAGNNGPMDWFVSAFTPSGALAWSTYVGGPNYDLAYAVEVDASGVYVAGRCGNGFPTTSGVLQPTFAGDSAGGLYGQQDGCVAKLALNGSSLTWSTYFGDTGLGFVRDIAIDSSGRVHVAANGNSSLSSKVTAGAYQPTIRGPQDAFYARLSPAATSVEYGTFLGGIEGASYTDANPSVRVAPGGHVYFLAQEPVGTNPPTTSGVYKPATTGISEDALVARFDGNTLAWATYLGGTDTEVADTHSLAVDPQGRPVIAVSTRSTNFGGGTNAGGSDVGVAALSADGTTLLAATQVGGSGTDKAEGVAIDACGNVYVTGFTASSNLPVTSGALVSTYSGSPQGLLVVLSADLQTRRYVSFDGIPGQYVNRSSMLSPGGDWAIVGGVWNLNPFPQVGGYDGTINGTHAAFFRVLEAQ